MRGTAGLFLRTFRGEPTEIIVQRKGINDQLRMYQEKLFRETSIRGRTTEKQTAKVHYWDMSVK